MKNLKESIQDTIELYEFIGQLKSENENLRKENAKLLTVKGGEPSSMILTEIEIKLIKAIKKNYVKTCFSDWRFPNIMKDDDFIPFTEWYKMITRDFLYGGPFDDFGLNDLKEFFKDELRTWYNNKVSEKKSEIEKEKTEKEKEE